MHVRTASFFLDLVGAVGRAGVAIDFHCQLTGFRIAVAWRAFPERFKWNGKIYPKSRQHHYGSWGSGLNQMAKSPEHMHSSIWI